MIDIEVKVMADSVSPWTGIRLTTIEACYPRLIHSEVMTHRVYSRNAASSRAIPIRKMIERVKEKPAYPTAWGKNQSGMQAWELLSDTDAYLAKEMWTHALNNALKVANDMADLGVHKQIVNRLLEPFSYITTIISGTSWEHFYNLRCHPDAQPEFQELAWKIRTARDESTPVERQYHTPYIQEDEKGIEWADACRISAGRCARVSYLTQRGVRDPNEDIKLCERLITSGHWSPMEHPAYALRKPERVGNFKGWYQYRKVFGNEFTEDERY